MVNLVFKWCEQGFRPLEKGLSDVKEEMVLQGPSWILWLTSWRPKDLKWIDRKTGRSGERRPQAVNRRFREFPAT